MSQDDGWRLPGQGGPAGPPAPDAAGALPSPGYYAGPYGTPPPGGPSGYAPYGAGRPGIVPLRPLAVGEILDGAIQAMRRYPRQMVGLSALVIAVQHALSLLVQGTSGGFTAGFALTSGGGTVATGSRVAWFGGLLVNGVLTLVLVGALTLVVSDAVLGRPTTLPQVWARLRPRLLTLLLASVVVGVVEVVGLVLLVLPGVFLWGALLFTAPAVVLERRSAFDGMRRSWRLAVPAWFRVFGVAALAYVITLLIELVVAGVVVGGVVAGTLHLASGASVPGWVVAVGTVVTIAVGCVVQPFVAGVVTLLYIDRRMRAEGLDLTLQQAASTTP